MTHQPTCQWEKAECEYKETHEYCPHQEHACTCPRGCTKCGKPLCPRIPKLGKHMTDEKEMQEECHGICHPTPHIDEERPDPGT